jgi:hypothetical protein
MEARGREFHPQPSVMWNTLRKLSEGALYARASKRDTRQGSPPVGSGLRLNSLRPDQKEDE